MTLPSVDTIGQTINTIRDKLCRAGKGFGLAGVVTAQIKSADFSTFTYSFRFDPKGRKQPGDVFREDSFFIMIVEVVRPADMK